MLTSLSLDRCKKGTDFTEVGELTGLTDLRITGREDIEDLTPIGRLAQLTHLSLSGCRAVEDTEPLLSLSRLRELNLSGTNVRSAHGFSQAFAVLESFRCPVPYADNLGAVDLIAALIDQRAVTEKRRLARAGRVCRHRLVHQLQGASLNVELPVGVQGDQPRCTDGVLTEPAPCQLLGRVMLRDGAFYE